MVQKCIQICPPQSDFTSFLSKFATTTQFRAIMKNFRHVIALLWLLAFVSISTRANTRILSSEDGLSNNAVYNICQDSLGVLYIGTLDGLNIWDGYKMERFRAADGRSYFEGNKIKHMFHNSPNIIFALTRHGLARINTESKDVVFMEDFDAESVIGIDSHENIFAISGDNNLYYINKEGKGQVIEGFTLDKSDECKRITVSESGVLHVFSQDGTWRITLDDTYQKPKIKTIENLHIKFIYVSEPHCSNPIYTITEDCRLLKFDHESGSFTFISSFLPPIGHDINRIKGVVRASQGYWINFWDQLFFLPDGSNELIATDIKHHSFTIVHDKYQPILWIGTDSKGLIGWSYQEPTIRSLTYKDLPLQISMPTRCMYLQHDSKTLVFGTKGEGLFRIRNFTKNGHINKDNIYRFHTGNSSLGDNSVYCIRESKYHCLLIGTEGNGINYMKEDNIGIIKGSERLYQIHQIAEHNDNTLWVTTDRDHVFKCHMKIRNGLPIISRIDTIDFRSTFKARTQIYDLEIQNDSIIWFGSKGHGCLCYNTVTGSSEIISFPKEYGVAINEVSQISNFSDMVFCTRNGIITRKDSDKSISVFEYNSPISAKAALKDSKGNLWVSTSTGIIVLDNNYNYLKSYGKFSGLSIPEYSDRACYRDEKSGTMFFGGTNGLTIIDEDIDIHHNAYNPQIHLTKYINGNEEKPLTSVVNRNCLKLEHNNSSFSLVFSCIDHINQNDYRFMYYLEGYDDKWHTIEGRSISFSMLPPGSYTLRIKYINSVTDTSSQETTLPIRVTPPIYLSTVAYIIYILIFAALVAWIIIWNRRKSEAAQEEIRKRYKERMQRIKADTSAAISEELSVTTTFILGVCQQIQSKAANIPSISEKVAVVEQNIDKIGRTLNTWNEFRKISETPDSSETNTLISISRTAKEILDLAQLSKKNTGIKLTCDILENIVFDIDNERFIAFFNTLTNSVFSIVTPNGNINFELSKREHGKAYMSFCVTTDPTTYRAFEGVNGALSTCAIEAEKLPINITHSYSLNKQQAIIEIHLQASSKVTDIAAAYNSENPRHDKIFIVSRNSEIISFLNYFTSDRYNISIFENNESAAAKIQECIPAAIIYDSSSLPGQISSFMEGMKAGKKTSQTPVISLVSSLATTEKNLCIKAGCDLCLAFPFNVETFLLSLSRLIGKKESAAEYYSSPDSSFVIEEGKAMHKEDLAFLREIVQIIDTNMADPKLSATIISEKLGIGIRALYRRIEKLTDKTLRNIIIESRMRYAAKLLVSTKLSIDEIMYRTGHDNPSTFYRNFKIFHGITTTEYRKNITNLKK